MASYLVLARKYRPSTFSDVVGQDHVIRTLTNSIVSGRIAHAFLFCGVRGVGKTTLARILAKSLNCRHRAPDQANPCDQCTSCREITEGISVDVQEIDGASHTSVENIREINENIKYPPVSSPYKIIIIDEVHMISINAFNALLKTLEEPPQHAKFIFATTESHKVPATIHSRCQKFNFRTISLPDIVRGISNILQKERITADEEALALVAREAQGSFRDALSLLDQVIAFAEQPIQAKDVAGILGIAGRDSFGRLMGAVIDRDSARSLGLVHELFHEGYDPEQFVMDLIAYLRNLIVVSTIPRNARVEGMLDAAPSEVDEMEELARRSSPEELQSLFGMLMRSESDIKRSGNPWIAAEMAVLRMSYAPQLVELSELVRRIDSQGPHSGSGNTGPRVPKSRSADSHPVTSSISEVRSDSKRSESPVCALEQTHEVSEDRFTITRVTPLPAGTPDEVWSEIKKRIARLEQSVPVLGIMEHGDLLSFGATEVEIGFNKPIYKEQFESSLQSKPEIREVFEDLFGGAAIRILTLARETPLATERQYASPTDGQTDLHRALKNEALENPITRAVLGEFEGSTVDDIKILQPKS